MRDVIPDLWPDEIAADPVLTPLAIMRYQADLLKQKTRGLVEAEITPISSAHQLNAYTFTLIAPALEGYRYPLFEARHKKTLVYPVSVLGAAGQEAEQAATQDEFLRILREHFRAEATRSVIFSILAQSHEQRGHAPTVADPRTTS